jgi:DNA-directed RNA polymerase omega subunit
MNNGYLERARTKIADPKMLVVATARRAKQLAAGARPMVRCDNYENHLDVALLEIAEGLIEVERVTADEYKAATAAAAAATAEAEKPAEAAKE